MRIDELRKKKILILGFGREGRDTFLFLRKLFPKNVLGIADINYKIQGTRHKIQNVKWHLGKDYLKAIRNYDLIIKSPGIPPGAVAPFIAKKQKITSQTEIFFENCPGTIIGVTGTKGKSTTASLIYQILKACPERSRRTHLVGNIGKPVLNLLFSATAKDVYVYELSSHQLQNLKKSPHIAVFLNIYPEHLDYYKNFQEYLKAKQNITRYQKKENYLIYNSRNKLVRETAKLIKAKKIPISNYSQILKNNGIAKISLLGEHNLFNIAAAIKVGEIFHIPQKIMIDSIRHFKPLPHRLEFVGTFRGIAFYNDALATLPEATIAALNALGKKVETIILGGSERNLDFKNLAKEVLESRIKTVILFPTTGERIWRNISEFAGSRGAPKHFFVDNMKDAVKLAYSHTQRGKICLLSTASPSFSLFRDYKQKGNLFKKYIKKFSSYLCQRTTQTTHQIIF